MTWIDIAFLAVGGVVLIAFLSAASAYFAFDRGLKNYIRDSSGLKEEINVNVLKQPVVITSQPTFADKAETEKRFLHIETKIEDSRVENKSEMEKLRIEAVEGRRSLHHDIDTAVNRITDKLDDVSLDLTNKVGELRGQVMNMPKHP